MPESQVYQSHEGFCSNWADLGAQDRIGGIPGPSNRSDGRNEGKKLCSCELHTPFQWPMDHAVIALRPCTYKCPYCPEFDDLEDTTPRVSEVQQHIQEVHLVNVDEFPGLTIVATRALLPRPWRYWGPSLTRRSRSESAHLQ
ncbi:uncharacterized protein N7515_001006 [Penicillium bovifimosum]|uniref:Uncharacterized protein n=1 Tax=Penicillium bovifimosum TaxID=126998 RepID=A0A9W9LBL8_9EURO|nr:uncharacterized protein N7515_001006 [Penicillium bovifimosum]KAJ5146442.1 hypothetical protein N7515_001006 [Penicillium bovifimosum]